MNVKKESNFHRIETKHWNHFFCLRIIIELLVFFFSTDIKIDILEE